MENQLITWIKGFINQYRNEITKLSNKENVKISNDKDLKEPLQVEVLWIIDKKKNDIQFFFLS